MLSYLSAKTLSRKVVKRAVKKLTREDEAFVSERVLPWYKGEVIAWEMSNNLGQERGNRQTATQR